MERNAAARILHPSQRDILEEMRFSNYDIYGWQKRIRMLRILRHLQRVRREAYLPVLPETLAILIRNLSRYYRNTGINPLINVVGAMHRIGGYPGIKQHPLVRAALQSHQRRTKGPALRAATFAEYKRWLELAGGDDPRAIQSRVLLTHHFLANCSDSEMKNLRIEALEITKTRAIWHECGIRGRTIWLDRGADRRYCPVAALEDWLNIAKLKRGSVLRSVHSSGKIMSYAARGATTSLRLVLEFRRLDPSLDGLTLSSIRDGGLVCMYDAKLSLAEIRKRSGFGTTLALERRLRRFVVEKPGCAPLPHVATTRNGRKKRAKPFLDE